MARRRFIYHHFVNNKEVTKEEFFKQLSPYCCVCNTHYDNPLMNIAVFDEKKYKRKYDHLKCHPHTTLCYIDDNMSFKITREEVHKCCICGKRFTGWGNNPDGALDKDGNPIKWGDDDVCCKECDNTYVLSGRIHLYKKGESHK